MKNTILKSVLVLVASAGLLTGCVNDDDFDIPPVKQLILSEGFEASTTGSGSIEVPITLAGWSNINTVGTRLWHARTFSSNKYAEFSSFYSDAGTSDEVWLVSPALDLAATSNALLSFETKIRFWTGPCLTVYVSEDYDGTPEGIATATWTALNPTLPVSGQEDIFMNSGNLDLSGYNSSNVRIAFKYTGSKQTGVTTTYQLDNIKVFEN